MFSGERAGAAPGPGPPWLRETHTAAPPRSSDCKNKQRETKPRLFPPTLPRRSPAAPHGAGPSAHLRGGSSPSPPLSLTCGRCVRALPPALSSSVGSRPRARDLPSGAPPRNTCSDGNWHRFGFLSRPSLPTCKVAQGLHPVPSLTSPLCSLCSGRLLIANGLLGASHHYFKSLQWRFPLPFPFLSGPMCTQSIISLDLFPITWTHETTLSFNRNSSSPVNKRVEKTGEPNFGSE